MTTRATWKASERRVAEDLGGRRIPVTGIDRDGADVVTPMFHIQVKLRKVLPEWLWGWLSGVRMDAKPHGKVGILILKKPRQKDTDGLVVMSYGDFVDLHGQTKPREDCLHCDGDGFRNDAPWGNCQYCHGSGKEPC